MLAIWRDF
jgi:dihydropyrimidine dehydrogenase (NADP+)